MATSKKPDRSANSFARRLEKEMADWHINQASIAARLRISPGTVSAWFTKGSVPQPRILSELANILGVTPAWLVHGKEPKLNLQSQANAEQVVKSLPVSASLRESPHSPASNAVAAEKTRMVKILSWAQAGMATAFEEIPDDWQDEIPIAVNDPKAFAIRLRGDSMEPRYQDGDVVTLTPSWAAKNGDLVVANIKEEGFAFKVMSLVGGNPENIRLTSYNPVYQPMDFPREKFHWIHPVHSVTKLVRR